MAAINGHATRAITSGSGAMSWFSGMSEAALPEINEKKTIVPARGRRCGTLISVIAKSGICKS